MAPRKRTHDTDLPRGLNRHRQRFRARSWTTPDGIETPKKRPEARPTWRYFDPPLADAARAYYEWRGDKQSAGEISDGLEAYLRSPQFLRLAPATQRTERPRVMRLSRVFGHMGYRQLKPVHCTKYLQQQPPQGGKKDMKRLSAIMTQWEALELVDRNFLPAVLRAWNVPDNARDRYVTDAEFLAAIKVAAEKMEQWPSIRRVWAAMMLVLFTGRRITDVRTIRLNDLRDEGIYFGTSKTHKPVIVPWTDELRAAVDAVKAMAPRTTVKPLALLPGRDGQPVTEGALNQAWQRLRPLLSEIEPFQLRDIRAKYGTDLEAAGRDGARNLDHASRRVFDIHYNRLPKRVEAYR